MSEHNDFLDHLRRLSLSVRHHLDQADASIPVLNRQIQTLSQLDIVPMGLVLNGPIIHRQPDTENPWQLISERIFEAVLVTPQGLGVIAWYSETYLAVYREYKTDFAEFRVRFQPYERLTPTLRSRLLAEAIPLIETLLNLLGPAPF